MKSKPKFDIDDPRFVFEVQLPTGGTRKIDREELRQLALNPTNSVPLLKGDYTGIGHYVGTFWSHFMGPVPFAIYFQLEKMAYGDKDHSFPSVPYLAMLCGCSPRTIQRNMQTLVELGFVVVLEVYDALTNDQMNNVYLLSNTVPFISKAQYNKLPDRLKAEHDKYMDKIKFKSIAQGQKPPVYKDEE